ncbi:hypothetical protein [Halorhabdus amylolytica]|uniref:hypothetical protein n=1 Tax=Halorhabdus amylolytica TaxID=2559573 RepID=UPI0020BD8A45|nr:hypothetical protein [Halorhabdus amylolytica]
MNDEVIDPTESTGESPEVDDGITTVTEAAEPAENTDWIRGWQVWVVLGVLFLAFLVVPWGLILFPTIRNIVRIVGFSFRDAYLVFPLVPALALGALGIWTALRSRGPN